MTGLLSFRFLLFFLAILLVELYVIFLQDVHSRWNWFAANIAFLFCVLIVLNYFKKRPAEYEAYPGHYHQHLLYALDDERLTGRFGRGAEAKGWPHLKRLMWVLLFSGRPFAAIASTVWSTALRAEVSAADVRWLWLDYPVWGLALQVSDSPRKVLLGIERWIHFCGLGWSTRDHETLHVLQDLFIPGSLAVELKGQPTRWLWLTMEVPAYFLGSPLVSFVAVCLFCWPLLMAKL